MTLREYLIHTEILDSDGNPVDLSQWCLRHGLTYSTVARHLIKNAPVRPKNAAKISAATEGVVPCIELLDPQREARCDGAR
jgi:hypothetical protein